MFTLLPTHFFPAFPDFFKRGSPTPRRPLADPCLSIGTLYSCASTRGSPSRWSMPSAPFGAFAPAWSAFQIAQRDAARVFGFGLAGLAQHQRQAADRRRQRQLLRADHVDLERDRLDHGRLVERARRRPGRSPARARSAARPRSLALLLSTWRVSATSTCRPAARSRRRRRRR